MSHASRWRSRKTSSPHVKSVPIASSLDSLEPEPSLAKGNRKCDPSNQLFMFSTNLPRLLSDSVVCFFPLCDMNDVKLRPVSMPAPGLTCSMSRCETPLATVTVRPLLTSSSSDCNLRYSSPLMRKNSSRSIAFLELALYRAMTTSPATGIIPPMADTALLNSILLVSQGGRSAWRALRTTRI